MKVNFGTMAVNFMQVKIVVAGLKILDLNIPKRHTVNTKFGVAN